MPTTPELSLIVPTRERPERLRAFLHSLDATAECPERVEVILVIDEDDVQSVRHQCQRISTREVMVPPRQTMGSLNTAGYEAARGRYLMLLNDDVVARTTGWDQRILDCFKSTPDDILLVHVNDGLFGESLCTFPIVSRLFCEMAGGICPRDYLRYRIDDHIEDIFNLLGLLGERRVIYLPDVLFEHHNVATEGDRRGSYVPSESILSVDGPRFDALRAERQEVAFRLYQQIQERAKKLRDQQARAVLATAPHAFTLRTPERHRVEARQSGSRKDPSLTIAIVARAPCKGVQITLDSVRAHTSRYQLILVEDKERVETRRGAKLNRILQGTRTDYLVVLAPGTRVRPGWVHECLAKVTGEIAASFLVPHERERKTLGIVSGPGVSLILDRTRCRYLPFDEVYHSGFADVDFGLRVLEAGFGVLVDRVRGVIGPATLGATESEGWTTTHLDADRAYFFQSWEAKGRFNSLQNRWSEHLAGNGTAASANSSLDPLTALANDIWERLHPGQPSLATRLVRTARHVKNRGVRCFQERGIRGLMVRVFQQFRRVRTPTPTT